MKSKVTCLIAVETCEESLTKTKQAMLGGTVQNYHLEPPVVLAARNFSYF